jgi:hypothetical protein
VKFRHFLKEENETVEIFPLCFEKNQTSVWGTIVERMPLEAKSSILPPKVIKFWQFELVEKRAPCSR